jgi:hypothetical protein
MIITLGLADDTDRTCMFLSIILVYLQFFLFVPKA